MFSPGQLIVTLSKMVENASGWLWGYPLMILLVGTGIYLTILLRGLQFRSLPHAIRLIFRKDEAEGDISHFAALMTALAATVGNGNIVGVATAIVMGGPGAVFWMWVTGLVGMATKYSEAVLAVKYRQTGKFGMSGGPMYYISHGAGIPLLGGVFAFFAAVAAFGIGNMVQTNSVAGVFQETFHVPPLTTGLVLMVLTGAVVLGGIRSIGRFTSFLVPVMIVGYCGASLLILAMNAKAIPHAFGLIFGNAFSPMAAGGGVLGFSVAQAIRFGVARGVFSNESGLGSSPIAAAAAKTNEPVTQALVSMTQTFIDTLVVCTMTALIILTSGQWDAAGVQAGTLTSLSFGATLGKSGAVIVALASAVFAYSTVIGWCYYGEKSIEYLLGTWSVRPYRVLFIGAVVLGAGMKIELVWALSYLMNGLMAIPNLIGLLVLSLVIRRETVRYFAGRRGAVSAGE